MRRALEAIEPLWTSLLAGGAILLIAWWLRHKPAPPGSELYAQLVLTDGLLALTFAAAALARFRGTYDRRSLIFAAGFAINGIVLVSFTFALSHAVRSAPDLPLRDPTTWVFSRMLLALLFVVPLMVEKSLLVARHPNREITIALLLVVLATGLLSTVHQSLPLDVLVRPHGIFSRPGNLFAAALFLIAVAGYRRVAGEKSLFDRSIALAASLNFLCCLAASQSATPRDAAFTLAAILQFASYVVLLGGALFDNVRLFDKIRQLAVSDPLTGLANYRRLIDSIDAEIERSSRTARAFSVVLLDLNSLKSINDQHGHLVGSRAICRVAAVLARESRTIDVPARYGGDEFALVLPETDRSEAEEVIHRICLGVSHGGEEPAISVSAGVAAYPRDGHSVEALLSAADRALYRAKADARVEPHATPASAQ